MLAIKNLSKKYGSHLVLQVPDLTIPYGTFWMEGGNGSGKSTFLKIIAGICPFDGAVSLDSVDLKKSPVAYRQEVSFAEAEPQFPQSLTGSELIAFVQKTRGASQQVQTRIDQFNISHFINQPVGTYSSGMLKKLSLLMAFTGKQRLILLDEPLITLDAVFIPVLFAVIKDSQSQGVSFLITSHQSSQHDQLKFDGKITVCDQSVKFEKR
jgi:ABC-2 type transport system ATP-binding protein